jgi:hypothetical protein
MKVSDWWNLVNSMLMMLLIEIGQEQCRIENIFILLTTNYIFSNCIFYIPIRLIHTLNADIAIENLIVKKRRMNMN